ncbi:MAG: zinc ribbon domain-containing protein [Idiomarina sp.]
MAIEKCPKCEDQVLDNKHGCPGCGYVKSSDSEQSAEPGNQPGGNNITTENTAKNLQVQGLLSVLLFVAGLIWFFLTSEDYQQRDEINVIPLIMFIVGFVWYVVTRFRIWSQNK